MPGESIKSYYSRFSKIMNDLERHQALPKIIASNTKFLNSLKHEWKKYLTSVLLAKNSYEADFDQLDAISDDPENNVTTTMMLLARAISQEYSTPTNNQFLYFINTRNQAYVPDG
ncbi:hypothetical protein Tco_0757430 [Tanacetum coccineum]